MPRAGSILQATGYRLKDSGFRIQDHRSGNGAKSGTGTVVGTEDGGKLEKSQGAKKMEMLKKKRGQRNAYNQRTNTAIP